MLTFTELSLTDDGVSYTFKTKSGNQVTAHGSIGDGFYINYEAKLGRKRSVEDQKRLQSLMKSNSETLLSWNPKPLSLKSEKQTEQEYEEAPDELPTLKHGVVLEKQENDNCVECLEVQPLKLNDYKVKNKTLASNAFVMAVKLIEESMSAAKSVESIKFNVMQVVKSPINSVRPGQTFTIKAKMAACPCLSLLDPGLYVITGVKNQKNKLVLSNVLMEFEN